MTHSMNASGIELRPIHRDILKLVRALCYEGLPETRMAVVDPEDRWLAQWEPNPCESRFTTPEGVPEPIIRACVFSALSDEFRQRWGTDASDPRPALQYLVDRALLETTYDDQPFCKAFKNYFNDAEIMCEIQTRDTASGRFYLWWVTAADTITLNEQGDHLVLGLPYAQFKLTERGHVLLDVEVTGVEPKYENPVNASSNDSKTQHGVKGQNRGRKPDTDPKEDKRIADAWSTGQYKTFAELAQALNLETGKAKRAVDRHRKRQ